MKKDKVILFLLISIGLFGCKKLETQPNELLGLDAIYDGFDKNGTNVTLVRNDLYSYIPTGYNRIGNVVLDAATDDAISTTPNNTTIEILSKSGLNSQINPDDRWATSYQAIRKVNLFLANVDKTPVNTATIAFWKAEARFIRALNYFELVKRYGGVPLIGDKVYGLNDDFNAIKRNTYADCVTYIVSECDAIKGLLMPEPIATQMLGSIPRGAAYALKSRMLLYAASPLNNPSNDLAKWTLAANAAKDLMTLSPAPYSLEASYNNVFLNVTNTEMILSRKSTQNKTIETNNAPTGFTGAVISYGRVSPSQNLVNAFPMINGRAIDDAASAYDQNNPYTNRDPRLGLTVFFNGTTWLKRAVETFDGGLDNVTGGIVDQTRTGYYMRKFAGNFAAAAAYTNQTHDFPIFRYAEILLNYAEAINETNNQAEALIQLVAIRKRAGIAAGTTTGYTYGLKTNMTQLEMQTAIRNERRIEMAFEEQRFWDLRRWKTAETVLNGDVLGVKIAKTLAGTFTYTTFVADKLVFDKNKMYLYPIPLTEIYGANGLTQNPNY